MMDLTREIDSTMLREQRDDLINLIQNPDWEDLLETTVILRLSGLVDVLDRILDEIENTEPELDWRTTDPFENIGL